MASLDDSVYDFAPGIFVLPSDSRFYIDYPSLSEGELVVDGSEDGSEDVSVSSVEPLPSLGQTQEDLVAAGYELEGIETFALSPIVSSSGLKGILLDLLGPYDNIVTQYQYRQNTSSSYSYVNEITPDYPWIFSAVLFIVLLFSVFRLMGVFFQWLK